MISLLRIYLLRPTGKAIPREKKQMVDVTGLSCAETEDFKYKFSINMDGIQFIKTNTSIIQTKLKYPRFLQNWRDIVKYAFT